MDDSAAAAFPVTLRHRLGVGTFGEVLAADGDDGAAYAVKLPVTGRGEKLILAREHAALRALPPHPCLVPLLGAAAEPDRGLILAFPRLAGDAGAVAEAAWPDGKVPARVLAAWAADLLHALHHLHAHDYVHRDVKTANVLVTAAGRAVLADLGACRRVPPGFSATAVPDAWTRSVCTSWFRAPEAFERGATTTAAGDAWAAGVCLLAWAAGRYPFTGKRADVRPAIMRQMVPQHIGATPETLRWRANAFARSFAGRADVDDAFFDLVTKLLVIDPARRCSVAAAVEHPFVQGAPPPGQPLDAEVLRHIAERQPTRSPARRQQLGSACLQRPAARLAAPAPPAAASVQLALSYAREAGLPPQDWVAGCAMLALSGGAAPYDVLACAYAAHATVVSAPLSEAAAAAAAARVLGVGAHEVPDDAFAAAAITRLLAAGSCPTDAAWRALLARLPADAAHSWTHPLFAAAAHAAVAAPALVCEPEQWAAAAAAVVAAYGFGGLLVAAQAPPAADDAVAAACAALPVAACRSAWHHVAGVGDEQHAAAARALRDGGPPPRHVHPGVAAPPPVVALSVSDSDSDCGVGRPRGDGSSDGTEGE
jgi:hypothetical protein